MKSWAAIVLAAGAGKRMHSNTPKVLHLLGGKPLLAYPLQALERLSPARVVVVIGHGADEIKRVVPKTHNQVWAQQRQQLGTGHAVLSARAELKDFDGDILILSGDVPFLSDQSLSQLMETHRSEGCALTMAVASLDDPTGYGRIERGPQGDVRQVVEQRDATVTQRRISEINVGLYAVSAEFLFNALDDLSNDNDQGEYYLPGIVSMAARRGDKIGTVTVEDAREFRGINNREELAWMEKALRDEVNRSWMARGVSLKDPDTTYIDADVTIGPDSIIGPNTHLLGRTVVGSRCRIDGSAYITNAQLADDVHLAFSVVLDDCQLGSHVSVGPFARLRPGTVLAERVHIGNFVEVKNSSVGEGTKASHLSYIGDTQLGKESNIGAGTITCNYNGFIKSRTVIGDRVQIGSDTQLVAPVVVGDDTYIGAGSTITKDVPPGTLALSRAPQKHVEGWVERFRAKQTK